MTDPTADAPTPTEATAAIQEILKDPGRLGLTWDLKPATVNAVPQNGPVVTIDGDDTAITATSMVGIVAIGQRVFVISIPPAGVFIVGRVGNSGSTYQQYVFVSSSTSAINFQNIPLNMRELEVSWVGRTTAGGALQNLRMRINGSSTASYTTEFSQSAGASTTSALVDSGANAAFVGQLGAGGAGASVSGAGKIWFPNTAGSPYAPNWIFENVILSPNLINRGGGVYTTLGAINFIQLFPETGIWATGSYASLKGVFI